MDVSSSGGMFLWGDDYIATEDDGEGWLVEPLIPASGLVNLYGKPKTAKSFAAIGMAVAISSDLPEWNGFPIRNHGPVMYFQIDTPRAEWKRRFRNVKAAGYDINQIAIIDMKIAPYPYNIITPQHKTWLKTQVDIIKPVFTVIDTIREVHEGNENDSTDMKKVVNSLVSIVRPSALAFVSHSRKDSAMNAAGAESDLMDEGRGSSYMSGRMDTVLKFTKKTMEYKGRSVEQTKVNIVQDADTGLVVLSDSSAKLEQLTLRMMREHPDWTRHKLGVEIAAISKTISYKTAERLIDKLRANKKVESGD